MELRKDPLTRSWVLTGDDIPETAPRPAAECRLCPGSKDRLQQVSSRAALFGGPWSALAATTFIPRRVLYELRAALDYFKQKERCVFCDLLAQEMNTGTRIVEVRGDFVAFCPYATRVPYETWILPRTHDSAFERFALAHPGSMRDLGSLLRRILQRIRTITESVHLVVHTSPNRSHHAPTPASSMTLPDDYHWHIEILPILAAKTQSYTFKEVYYSPVSPETAAKRLREAAVEI